MVKFTYVIQDAQGLHARPVTQVCAAAQGWESEIALSVPARGVSCDARDLLGLMALAATCGEELEVSVEGPDEAKAARALRAAFTF